ncbi:MAG: tetratricopeptide repeat protein [Acidobacteria bacterium]|nr:tetratricopeptide repeat protein [Acidobacteriota bacterium]
MAFALAAMLACTPCHQAIVDSYARTGMGRSFFALTQETRVEDFAKRNRFFHAPSKSWFIMTEREGRFYMRREHADGVMEKELHYVLGSGNHARSYVHRTSEGRLLAMPVSWYAEKGGFWQMAPGYDRPDHVDFRRKINYECFFCHNAYPGTPGGDESDPLYLDPLPEGVDCARCHGTADKHLSNPRRGTILNPKTLSWARQMELCMQCHLETTSHPLPHSIRRYGRGMFSYRPGEPLENYMVHFDHPAGGAYRDKFEVVSAPYRLRKSACFLNSRGRMSCTTCHDPHARTVKNACPSCHRTAHHKEKDCAGCHMARRRPEDARLTTMTDHRIQRKPDAQDPSELPEYAGRVAAYYPPVIDKLYLALAQVRDAANLGEGVVRLQRLAAGFPRAEFHCDLAEAYRKTGRKPEAVAHYQQALAKMPSLVPAWRGLALVEYPNLEAILGGLKHAPRDAFLLTLLGTARGDEADLRAAMMADPDLPEAYVNLGALLAHKGEKAEAVRMFRQALAIDPRNQAALANLKLALTPAVAR